jgi:hypothetical protein
MLLARAQLADFAGFADHDLGTRVVDAVREIGVRDAVRERHEHGSEPLASPVQLDGLGLIGEDARNAGSDIDSVRGQPRSYAGRGSTEVGIRHSRAFSDERLTVRSALARVEEREGQVHEPATSAIASTIAV